VYSLDPQFENYVNPIIASYDPNNTEYQFPPYGIVLNMEYLTQPLPILADILKNHYHTEVPCYINITRVQRNQIIYSFTGTVRNLQDQFVISGRAGIGLSSRISGSQTSNKNLVPLRIPTRQAEVPVAPRLVPRPISIPSTPAPSIARRSVRNQAYCNMSSQEQVMDLNASNFKCVEEVLQWNDGVVYIMFYNSACVDWVPAFKDYVNDRMTFNNSKNDLPVYGITIDVEFILNFTPFLNKLLTRYEGRVPFYMKTTLPHHGPPLVVSTFTGAVNKELEEVLERPGVHQAFGYHTWKGNHF